MSFLGTEGIIVVSDKKGAKTDRLSPTSNPASVVVTLLSTKTSKNPRYCTQILLSTLKHRSILILTQSSAVAMVVERTPQRVVVVGAGPVGALAAIYAATRGDIVEVYELRAGRPAEMLCLFSFRHNHNLILSSCSPSNSVRSLSLSPSPPALSKYLFFVVLIVPRSTRSYNYSS